MADGGPPSPPAIQPPTVVPLVFPIQPVVSPVQPAASPAPPAQQVVPPAQPGPLPQLN